MTTKRTGPCATCGGAHPPDGVHRTPPAAGSFEGKAEGKAEGIRKALLVMVTTAETRSWLVGNDPMALRQAEDALQSDPELEAFFSREREKVIKREPGFCPFCGKGTKLFIDVAPNGWPTHSSEDPENKAVLSEHQCSDCGGKSFWT